MAVPACMRLADDVFPQARALVARRLVDEGWSQTRTASALGISQAMVSKIVGGPRPNPAPLARRLAQDLHAELLHPSPAAGPSLWCSTLSVSAHLPGADSALDDLLEAQEALMVAPPMPLVPQIGINIARALPGSTEPEDVLAFPARLVEAGGRLLCPAPPALGGSTHLAKCLLHLRSLDPGIFALASVRGGSDVERVLPQNSARIDAAQRKGDSEAPFRAAVAGPKVPRFIHDAGGFGIEPCLYVAAADAVGAAQVVLDLARKMKAA